MRSVPPFRASPAALALPAGRARPDATNNPSPTAASIASESEGQRAPMVLAHGGDVDAVDGLVRKAAELFETKSAARFRSQDRRPGWVVAHQVDVEVGPGLASRCGAREPVGCLDPGVGLGIVEVAEVQVARRPEIPAVEERPEERAPVGVVGYPARQVTRSNGSPRVDTFSPRA